MTLVILSACVDLKDGICTTSCPVDCIYEGERMFYIHPTECIECGMCESICPVDAIRYDDEVPEGEEAYAQLNTAVFQLPDGTVNEPGGWSKGMAPLRDPPALAEMATEASKEKELS
ncbi:MAG: ferredoxin family protein [Roseicyclus sp.]|nr:ferredoxin family protein [Roseicyclus sp.]